MQAATLCSALPCACKRTLACGNSSLAIVSRRAGLGGPLPKQRRSPAAQGGTNEQKGRGRLLVAAAIKTRKGKQVLCNKTLKAKEGSEAAMQELCRGVAEWSQTRMADRGSGVLAFQFSEDDFDRGVFHFLELYASQSAMAEHNGHEKIKSFVKQLQQHLDGPLGMVLYEYDNGRIGPASMEGDVKGEGGLDDATGTNKFGGGASMKQTSSVVNLTNIKEHDDEEKGLWGIKGLQIKLPSWVGGKKEDEK